MPERYTAVVDLHLILRRGNRILLGQRINTGFADGSFALPSGHLEAGEAATQGMAREAGEEIGVEIDPADLALLHTMHHRTNTGRVAFFFEAAAWRGEITNSEPEKCAGWTWYDLDALPAPLVPYTAEALDHIRNRIAYSERGWNEPVHSPKRTADVG
jgi:ADP-ribose pyrophosphatase YjhB (NUDIX family)